MARLERKVQRINELLACFNQQHGLDLHWITQHQFFWIRMQIDLLVDALRHRMAVVANRSYKTGHKRHKPLSLTTRLPIATSEAISRMPERKPIAFEPFVLSG